jgi:hypothetical protein
VWRAFDTGDVLFLPTGTIHAASNPGTSPAPIWLPMPSITVSRSWYSHPEAGEDFQQASVLSSDSNSQTED